MVSHLNIFVFKLSKIAAQKKVFFVLILSYKTWWKPRFPIDKRPLVEGRIAHFGISLDFLRFSVFGDFFRFSRKLGFGVFLVHPPMASVLLSASVERCFVPRMRDFF